MEERLENERIARGIPSHPTQAAQPLKPKLPQLKLPTFD
ncbi:unnamed protein product, partial [Allacma fusca]